jgi:hypothetical protein
MVAGDDLREGAAMPLLFIFLEDAFESVPGSVLKTKN